MSPLCARSPFRLVYSNKLCVLSVCAHMCHVVCLSVLAHMCHVVCLCVLTCAALCVCLCMLTCAVLCVCLCMLTCAALCVCLCMLTCAVSIAATDPLPLPCETQKSSGLAAGTLTCSAISLALGSHYFLYACELFVYSFWVYQPISLSPVLYELFLPSLLLDLLIEI